MAKIPPLPPARCQSYGPDSYTTRCGRPATHERVSRADGSIEVFCGNCASADDRPLHRPLTLPIVSVTCEVAFAGTSRDSAEARSEVIHTLQLAVLGAGGRLTVTGVTSVMARYYPSAALPWPPAATGKG